MERAPFTLRPAQDYRALAREVPFYRDGIPARVDKDAVRGRAEELLHPLARDERPKLGHTSGSTGAPLTFYESALDHAAARECYNRLYQMLPGRHYRALTIRDVASTDAPDAPPFVVDGPGFEHLFRQLSSRESCDLLADRVESEAPGLLEGYPSILHLLARVLVSRGRTLPSVEVISPCGELCDARDREVFARAFPQARVFNRYGCLELGSLAWECPLCGWYHFNTDHYALRIEPDQELVVSKRFPSACQLAHYALGDKLRFVSFGECPVPLPAVEVLAGRRDQLLIDDAGEPRRILIFYGLQEVAGLLQWQLVQRADGSLELYAVVEREGEALRAELERTLRADLGPGFGPLSVRFVRALNATAKGVRVVSERTLGEPGSRGSSPR